MTSFLIVGKEKAKRDGALQNLCTEFAVQNIDKTVIQRDSSTKTSTQSIGIEEIILMQKALILKPIKSKTKAVIIEDAQLLTTQAQNALLKVLEEPPEHTILILCATSKEALLPTILSRCKTLLVGEEAVSLSAKEKEAVISFLKSLPDAQIGDLLKKAEQMSKDKEKTLAWVTHVLVYTEELLHDDPTNTAIPEILRAFQKLHTTLSTTNVNPRFAIETTLLSL